jgi:hypothetical protein
MAIEKARLVKRLITKKIHGIFSPRLRPSTIVHRGNRTRLTMM